MDSLEELKCEQLRADREHEAVVNTRLEKANGSSEHAQLHPRAQIANGIAESRMGNRSDKKSQRSTTGRA